MMSFKHMKALKNSAVILLFIALLFGCRMIWLHHFGSFEEYQITRGVLDLRGMDLTQMKPVKLNGEWEFYPEHFVMGQSGSPTEAKPSYVQVPGSWAGAFANTETAAAFGYGTYRMRILVDPLQQPVSFWMRSIQSASSVEINGMDLAYAGMPAALSENYRARNISYTASYYVQDVTELELLVHVANFDDPNLGGILRPIRFGVQEEIESVRWYSIAFQLAIFIILVLHGMYAFVAFAFNRKEPALLLGGLFIITAGFAVLVRHDNLLLLWLPLTHAWGLKLKILLLMWQTLFILLIFRKFSAAGATNKLLRCYIALHCVYSVFLIAAPVPLIYKTVELGLSTFFYLFPFAWFIYTVGVLLFKRQDEQDIVFILLSAAGIISNLLWSLRNASNDITIVYYPLDIAAALVGFLAYWFKQYFRKASENNKLNEQLRAADKLKDQFLANTSHELRTPLHGIINIAQTVAIKEKGRLHENSLKDMELLIRISRHMSHLLGDLLDIARLREQRITLQCEPLRIQSIVPGVMGMLEYMKEGKPIEFRMDISDSTPLVMADEKRMIQILYNLLHNALKYTPEGLIAVTAETHGHHVIIHVSDTGVGMDEHTLARAFRPYEQGTHGMSDGRGLGLGLSICSQLVEQHGSSLSVRSKTGKGSVFSFGLPVAESGAAGNPSASQTAKPSGQAQEHNQEPAGERVQLQAHPQTEQQLRGAVPFLNTAASEFAGIADNELVPPLLSEQPMNILAVDDDPVNLSVLAGILSTEPYTLTTASSATEALELLDTKPWDLLVVDVMMPGISGYELTRKIRARYSLSELPILLLTARSQREDIYAGFLAGANDYVTKPVDALELKYRIGALAKLKQSVQEHQRMEAAYLQAQIKPHFLFNTMNSIMALSRLDIERMRTLIDAFASYLRISFDFLNTGELVELDHELELVQAYLQIEQERFANPLHCVWEVEADRALRIPPLSIQPIVENALRHGLLGQPQGGILHIRIARLNSAATLIEIGDNGKGMDQQTIDRLLVPSLGQQGGIGIANTNRRLIQLYGRGLTIHSVPGEGTTVSFVIPNQAGRPLRSARVGQDMVAD